MPTEHPGLAAAMQRLGGAAMVDLYELDTSPIYRVHGVDTPGGQVYRWTSGAIDVSVTGRLAASTNTTTVLTLDRLVSLQTGRTYRVVVALDANTASDAMEIASTATVSIANPDGPGNISVTRLTLDGALPSAPSAAFEYVVFGVSTVRFGGTEYLPMPIEAVGFEWAGTGKLPRPKLRVSNVGRIPAALVIANGGLEGAEVRRIRTFREFLDDGETPDPTAIMGPEMYVIDRKSTHNKQLVEFELASPMDHQGLRLPRRAMLRDTCDFTYRRWVTQTGGTTGFVMGTCPYAGAFYYKADDTGTMTQSEDVCSQKLSGCILRFGASAPLPFGGFPGLGVGGSR